MFFKRIVGIVLATSFLMACSNDDDNSKGQGSIGFLHTVADAAQIRVEGSNRYYGTYFYETMGAPMVLTEGGYSVDIVEQDLQNSARNKELTSSSFSVSSNRIRLAVMHGQVTDASDNNTVTLSNFVLARDDDAGRNENDDSRYLNVSNVFTGSSLITFTFKNVAGDTLHSEELAFGATSETIEFDSQRYILTVTNDTGAEIYQSAEQPVEDQKEQTVVIANYAGISNTPDASVKAYYYGTVYRRVWGNQLTGSEGYLKVSSVVLENNSDVVTTLDPLTVDILKDDSGTPTSVGTDSIVYGTSGEYINLPPGEYWLEVNDGVNVGIKKYFVTVEDDVAKNMSFSNYYNASTEAVTPLVMTVDKRKLSNFVTVHFQNLVSNLPNDDSNLTFDIHISSTTSLDSSTLMIASVSPRSETKFSVNLDISQSYKLYLTETGDADSSLASYDIAIANGEGSISVFAYNHENGLGGVLGIGLGDGTKIITPTP